MRRRAHHWFAPDPAAHGRRCGRPARPWVTPSRAAPPQQAAVWGQGRQGRQSMGAWQSMGPHLVHHSQQLLLLDVPPPAAGEAQEGLLGGGQRLEDGGRHALLVLGALQGGAGRGGGGGTSRVERQVAGRAASTSSTARGMQMSGHAWLAPRPAGTSVWRSGQRAWRAPGVHRNGEGAGACLEDVQDCQHRDELMRVERARAVHVGARKDALQRGVVGVVPKLGLGWGGGVGGEAQ